MQLGPGVNIHRTPLCGRNFEYFGEDPFQISEMAVSVIRGTQSVDVSACVKHFALNNQELDRNEVDVIVDERALREIYLPAFKAAVQKGDVHCVMGAYNRFLSQPCCQNVILITDLLKEEWGFKGVLMSDWGAKNLDVMTAASNGLDVEMSFEKNQMFGVDLPEAVQSGKLPMAILDEKARRVLRLVIENKMMTPEIRQKGSIDIVAHSAVARNVAAEAIVLLKNDGVLPLDAGKIKTLVVIGENATAVHARGGDSSGVNAKYEITPLEALQKKLGDRVKIIYDPGYTENTVLPDDTGAKNIDGKDVVTPERAAEMRASAVAAAKNADAVLIFAGQSHRYDTEGSDRNDMKLHHGQNELIAEVLAANPKTAIFLVGGSEVEMPWIDKAPAVLQAWYAGMEGGNAMADIAFGDVDPSGKLPFTFPKHLEDSPAHALGEYKAANCIYKEGIEVGYRYFDKHNIEPLFPFGHGLSYTTFELSDMKISNSPDDIQVAVNVKNSGKRAGAEVVQIYVDQPGSGVARPVRELKGFRKIFLQPGEQQTVKVDLDQTAFAYWDVTDHGWKIDPAPFFIEAGCSSRDIRITQPVDVKHVNAVQQQS
jgi:beta-glucosidase